MPVRIYACMSEISIFAGLSYLELTLNKKAAITIISLTAAFSSKEIQFGVDTGILCDEVFQPSTLICNDFPAISA